MLGWKHVQVDKYMELPRIHFCLQKPWLQVNEYHMIMCGETLIIFRVELVEGKDRLDELEKKRMNNTVGINAEDDIGDFELT